LKTLTINISYFWQRSRKRVMRTPNQGEDVFLIHGK